MKLYCPKLLKLYIFIGVVSSSSILKIIIKSPSRIPLMGWVMDLIAEYWYVYRDAPNKWIQNSLLKW